MSLKIQTFIKLNKFDSNYKIKKKYWRGGKLSLLILYFIYNLFNNLNTENFLKLYYVK